MSPLHLALPHRNPAFERITRQVRWWTIGVVVLTFPFVPQAMVVYAFAILAVLYNASRYWLRLLRQPWFASPVTILVMDNVLVALLLLVVSSANTAYTGFLVLMITSAAYRYGLKGSLATTIFHSFVLFLVTTHPWFSPLQLDAVRVVVLGILVLLILGLLVERLTHMEREERETLERLSRENESERKRLFTLVNSLNDAIFVLNGKGLIELHNGAAQALVASNATLERQSLVDVLPLHQRSKPHAKPVMLLESRGPQHRRDLSILGDNGIVIDLDINVMPVQLDGQKETDYVVVCKDITKERSLDEQREEFISVASHELRTPLAIVEAALSTAILSKDSLAPQMQLLLEQAHRNAVFLAGLVQDLTTLARAQNDNLPIQLGPVDARALLHQLAKDFTPQANEKKLKLTVQVAARTPSVLSTEHHIREVLQNYVGNALKYTASGSITLRAEPTKNGGVQFSVHDTGIGISPTDQAHLFTKFYRAEDFRTRETGGTGLGLYLCLALAERLNAKVWCQSVLNEGSTFYLEVPPFSQLERDRGKVVEAQVSSLVDQL